MARNRLQPAPFVAASEGECEYYSGPTTYQQKLTYWHFDVRGMLYTPRSDTSFLVAPLAQTTPSFSDLPNAHISDLKPYEAAHSRHNGEFDYLRVSPSLNRTGFSGRLNPEASKFEPRSMNFLNSPYGGLDLGAEKNEALENFRSIELVSDSGNPESVIPTQLGFAASCYETPSNSHISELSTRSSVSFDGSDVAYGADEHDHQICSSIESDTANDHTTSYQIDDNLNSVTYTQIAPMQPVLHSPVSHTHFDYIGAPSLKEDAGANRVHNIADEYEGEEDYTPSGIGEDSVLLSAYDVQTEESSWPQITQLTKEQETTAKLKEGLAMFKKLEGDQIILGSRVAFWTAPPQDDTIPISQVAKDSCHQKLVAAILNNVGCIENENSKSFQNRWADGATFYAKCEIEAIALEVLNLAIGIHQVGWTKPIFDAHMREEIFKTCLFKFEERFNALISLLTISKNTCEALLKCERLHAVVGNPWMLDKRVRSNKASNGKKASRIAFATAAEKQEKVAQLNESLKDSKDKGKTGCAKRAREDDNGEESGTVQVLERPTKCPRRSARTKA